MDRSLILALWSLGRLKSEELPEAACDWLASGHDSPSLRHLAGNTSPIMSDVAPLFERAISELGFRVPQKNEALHQLGRYYARQIVDGTISPYAGARRIWWEVSNKLDHPTKLFLSFVGAASEWEDIPDGTFYGGAERKKHERELEALVMGLAEELLRENLAQPPEPGA